MLYNESVYFLILTQTHVVPTCITFTYNTYLYKNLYLNLVEKLYNNFRVAVIGIGILILVHSILLCSHKLYCYNNNNILQIKRKFTS